MSEDRDQSEPDHEAQAVAGPLTLDGVWRMPPDILEENYEGVDIMDQIMADMTERLSRDLERQILVGIDPASGPDQTAVGFITSSQLTDQGLVLTAELLQEAMEHVNSMGAYSMGYQTYGRSPIPFETVSVGGGAYCPYETLEISPAPASDWATEARSIPVNYAQTQAEFKTANTSAGKGFAWLRERETREQVNLLKPKRALDL